MENKYNFEVGDVLNFEWSGMPWLMVKFHNYIKYGYSKTNRWTHTAIIGEIIGDKIYVYEALTEGFTRVEYSYVELMGYLNDNLMVVGKSRMPLHNVKENCDKYLGRPYGFLDILSIILYTIFGNLSFKIYTGSKQLICSEAVARILYDSSKEVINFEIEFGKRYDLITPIDLYHSRYIFWAGKSDY